MSDVLDDLRAAADYQIRMSGSASDYLLEAENEIKRLRAEVERMRAYVTQILLIAHQNMVCRNECGKLCREALEAKP